MQFTQILETLVGIKFDKACEINILCNLMTVKDYITFLWL